MIYPAHIRYDNDEKLVQTVNKHSRAVAEYAAENARSLGLYNCAYLAGLLHDMGKCTAKFADYIEKSARNEKVIKGSVNHTFCGVVYLFLRYHIKECSPEAMTCEAIAYAIGSHHGLLDIVTPDGDSGFCHRVDYNRDDLCYDEAVNGFLESVADENEIDGLFVAAVKEMTKHIADVKAANKSLLKPVYFTLGMTARALLAAVIDGDRRDTAEFICGKKQEYITADREFWNRQLSAFESEISKFKRDSNINRARGEFSDKCRDFGRERGGGVYRLSLPTGGGKTLAALRYTLTNAAAFSRKRIFFVIPLLSILEQNSEVIRKYILDKECITEHHSNVIINPNSSDELDRYELMTETWKAPIIITTLVQLLNTLFSGKTTSVRRMNALTDSIIVIDEIQSLPKKTISMFNSAVNFLTEFCGATVVLSSATQPCLSELNAGLRYFADCEIVPYDEELFSVFKRTEIIDKTTPYGMTVEELAEFAADISNEATSLLIICNTKNSADKLYSELGGCGCKLFYLSSSMCQAHRRDTLNSINQCLGSREKIICVSTQLVEAGVDFSFESVIRVIAGIDNIAQAAGRCNRSNDFGGIKSVYVVNLKAGCENLRMLREIAAAQRCTAKFLYSYHNAPERFDSDILSDKSIAEFYSLLFGDIDIKTKLNYPAKDKGGRSFSLYSLLADNSEIQRRSFSEKYIFNQSFKTAGELFEVFDEGTTEIIVPYNKEAEEIIANLSSEEAKHDFSFVKKNIEKAKPYVIRIFEYQRQALVDAGMLYSVCDGRALALNKLCYSDEKGLFTELFML